MRNGRASIPILLAALGVLLPSRSDATIQASAGYIVTQYVTLPLAGYADIEVDAFGNLYVSGCSSNKILKVDPSRNVTTWSTAPACDLTWSGSGTAYGGGSGICNCIHAIAPDGTYSVLHQDSLSWTSVLGLTDGSLYANVWGGSGQGLYSVDVTKGQVTPVVVGGPGPGGTGSFQGMAQGADGKVYVLGSTTAGNVYRLDGSQLQPITTMVHGGSSLSQGPGGSLLTNVNWTGALGYPVSELFLIDPALGTTTRVAQDVLDAPHIYPRIIGITWDVNTQTAYLLESNGKIWTFIKVPPIEVSFGEGFGSADTVQATVQWPIQVNTPVYANVERCTETTPFSGRGSVHVSSSGTLWYQDRFVVPGTRYGYRASVQADTGTVQSSTVWVDVPPLTPPPPPVVIWSEGSVAVDTSSATLDWPINPIITGDVRVERRTSASIFGSVAAVHLTGDGHVRFVDTLVARGTSYVYRAGVATDTGWVWSDSLTADIPAVSSPPPPPAIWSKGSVAVDTSSVTLDWPIASFVTGQVRVERRDDDGVFGWIGFVNLTGDGHVHLVDRSVAPGDRYVYRAGLLSDGAWDWSDELVADVPTTFEPAPATYVLAFARKASIVMQGSIQADFTVPAPGSARIDAYDVHGRRVASSTIEASRAGPYTAQLVSAVSLKPGMYYLRLTLGSATAQSRAIVLRSH